jgi:hypothetical protein
VERGFRGSKPIREPWDWLYPFKAALTFALVMIGWVFFRAADLPQSAQVLAQMFHGGQSHSLFLHWQRDLVVLALILAIGEEKLEWFDHLADAPALVYGSALALVFFFIELFGAMDASIPFIYFQF